MSARPLYPSPRPAIQKMPLAKSSGRVWRPDSKADAPPLTTDRRSFCARKTGQVYPQCMILLFARAVVREGATPAGPLYRFANPHGCPFCVYRMGESLTFGGKS